MNEKELRKMLWAGKPWNTAKSAIRVMMLKRDETEATVSADQKHATRALILDAFAELRSKGFMARANFKCCTSCASYDLGELSWNRILAKRAFNGMLYFHAQDEESWWQNGRMCIGFSNYERDGKTYGLPAEQIGLAIVTALVKRGVQCQWDGEATRKVAVYA